MYVHGIASGCLVVFFELHYHCKEQETYKESWNTPRASHVSEKAFPHKCLQ